MSEVMKLKLYSNTWPPQFGIIIRLDEINMRIYRDSLAFHKLFGTEPCVCSLIKKLSIGQTPNFHPHLLVCLF